MRPVGHPLLMLPRAWKRFIVVSVDVLLCVLTIWFAYYLRLGIWVSMYGRPTLAAAISLFLFVPAFAATGMYRIVLRHAGADTLGRSATACGLYGLAFATLISAYGINGIPRTIGLIQPALLFLTATATRVGASFVLSGRYRRLRREKATGRAFIYGAGSSGQQLASAMADSRELKVVGFLDDDRSLHKSRVRGFMVFDPAELASHIDKHQITDVLLALPSASRARRNTIIAALKSHEASVRTLPGLMDLAHGTVQASDLRDLTIDDLLGREPVAYDRNTLEESVRDRVVMVTGAGGSIGSELCRQLYGMKPTKLLLVESSEYALYSINHALNSGAGGIAVPLLASILDRRRMRSIMETWQPAMVFHAAAYKHVPLVEHNSLEGLRNNVIGTLTVAQEALRGGVERFVLVSTDKAVRPTNIMGASKRLGEMVLQGLASSKDHRTRFSMVRFGNVLGSSGSVVPLFRDQIARGGPITLTHQDVTRYFMTIPEAAHLVLQAGLMARGGEVFVLDMGEPVRIYDLACNLVELSGLSIQNEANPDGDIEVVMVGMRPGEKMFEELLIGNNPGPTAHPRIMTASEPYLPLDQLEPKLEKMAALIAHGDVASARELLLELVPEYVPVSDIVDYVYVEGGGHRNATMMANAV